MNNQWKKKGTVLLEEIRNTLPGKDLLHIWYVGQMGIVLKYQHTVLAIDPVFNDLTDASGKTRRNYAPPFCAASFDLADHILCTHAHADHMNLQTLLPIHNSNKDTRFIVPSPECRVLTDGGILAEAVTGAKAGKALALAEDITVIPIASAHEDYRTDEKGDHYFLGFILQCGPFRLYHAGDTLLTDQLVRDLRRFDRYDVVFLPINGRDEERHRRGILGNMDYKEAACLADAIHADLSIPLHHDMVRNNTADPCLFAGYMDDHYPGRPYTIMELGEKLVLRGPFRQ